MTDTAPPPANARPIRFYHRGAIVSIQGPHSTRTVLDWLREDARCSGTKEGCNEGDCGACTVVLGELGPDGQLRLASANACIQFLPTLDGKALFTVQDLQGLAPAATSGGAGSAQPLHPVQQALVECHGSQCGFCTPGFAMSLWNSYERHQQAGTRPTRQQLADELSGNLCRCTGYRPILDAGQRMFDLPTARLDRAAITQALQGLAREPALTYSAPGPTTGQARAARFHAPRSIQELAALRLALPQARLLAGGTDIGLWVNKQFRDVGELIYLGPVSALRAVQERGQELWIGAGATLEQAWAALAARAPALTDVWLRFASPPIRHTGTMGGNLANGSPIGDAAPILMALDAELELRRGDALRRLPLPAFYLGYMQNALQEGEFVQAIVVPQAAFARQLRGYKISKRFDCDISALCAGMAIELDGETVASVRLAYGGMAATVRRAAQAEAALLGRPWNEDSVRAAQQALAQDFQPLTDMRASSAYRLQVAQNLLRRLWLETRPDDPLDTGATSVFSVMPHAQENPS
ncbi:xanthine dehydrogenase small subunit [Alicycliphilus denitrificans]|uniref:xanthine dehydrogenase small subunit n=1 Tax=Alicycliphilus denitrificans TaxID=179636 RepID=UPI00384DD7EA